MHETGSASQTSAGYLQRERWLCFEWDLGTLHPHRDDNQFNCNYCFLRLEHHQWQRYSMGDYQMGYFGKRDDKLVSPPLRRTGDKGRYRGFPLVRHKRSEFHVYMGFPTQQDAEKWVDWGVRDGFLTKGEGMKKGLPGKPK